MKSLKTLLKRFLIGVVIFAILAALVVYGGRSYLHQVGTRELAEVNARLDANEPGWRFDAIESARLRKAPPPEQNSAVVVLKVAEDGSVGKDSEWIKFRNSEEWGQKILTPRLPAEKVQQAMRLQKEPTGAPRAEADEPWVRHGLRGERASVDRMFEGLESGKLPVDDFAELGMEKPNAANRAAFTLYKGLLPGDHAKALELLTAYIVANELPYHERTAAFKAIAIPPGPPEEFRYTLTRLLVPACEKVSAAGLRARAELLCAAAAIACERFRQANGRWPESLAEIPTTILPEIPTDPYDGLPLKFTRLPHGIAVHSVGDGDPNLAQRQAQNKDPLAGLGYGWRLWDADWRRQPPLPDAKDAAAGWFGGLPVPEGPKEP